MADSRDTNKMDEEELPIMPPVRRSSSHLRRVIASTMTNIYFSGKDKGENKPMQPARRPGQNLSVDTDQLDMKEMSSSVWMKLTTRSLGKNPKVITGLWVFYLAQEIAGIVLYIVNASQIVFDLLN